MSEKTLKDGWVGVGAAADFSNPMDWLGDEWGKVTNSWNQGDWGYSLGQAALLPFEAANKAVGYAIGGPVMGSLMAFNQATGATPKEGYQYDINPIPGIGLSGWVPGTENTGDLFDWKKAQQRYNAVSPGLQMAMEGGLQLGAGKVGGVFSKLAEGEKAQQAAQAAKVPGMPKFKPVAPEVPTTPPNWLERAEADPTIQKMWGVTKNTYSWGIPLSVAGSTAMRDDPNNPDKDWFQRGAEGLAAGFAVKMGVDVGAMGAVRLARNKLIPKRPNALSKWDQSIANSPDGQLGKEVKDNLADPSAAMAEGFEHPGYKLPTASRIGGGLLSSVTDKIMVNLLDRFYGIDKIQNATRAAKFARTGDSTLAEHENPMDRLRTFMGFSKDGETYIKMMAADAKSEGIDLGSKRVEGQFDRFLQAYGIRNRLVVEKRSVGYTDPTTGKRTSYDPTNTVHISKVEAWYRSEMRQLEKELGTDFVNAANGGSGKFLNLLTKFTDNHFNPQLLRQVKANVLSPAAAQHAMQSRSIYYYMFDVERSAGGQFAGIEDVVGPISKQAKTQPTLTASTSGVGWVTPDIDLPALTTQGLVKQFLYRERLIEKNRIGQSLVNMRAYWKKKNPATGVEEEYGWAKMLRPITAEEATKSPRTGFRHFSVLQQEQDLQNRDILVRQWYEVEKEIGDVLDGMDTEAADWLSRANNAFGGIFRSGVTAMSIPFIIRNIARDVQTAIVNNGFSTLTTQSHMSALFNIATDGRLGPVVDKLAHLPIVKNWKPWESIYVKDAAGNPVIVNGQRITYLDEMYLHGGGMGTLSEVIRGEGKGVMKPFTSDRAGMVELLNPFEAISGTAGALELSTRLGVYRTARVAGKTAEEAALLARNVTVDFSRSGNIGRVMNMWLPLLNARMQGTARTIDAYKQDPTGVMMRTAITMGYPLVQTYIHNNEYFPDLYPKIPQNIKDSYFNVIFGSYTDRLGDTRPVYFSIPKDPLYRMWSGPLETMMDMALHLKAYGQTLPPEKRAERDLSRALWDGMVSASPITLDANDLSDPTDMPYMMMRGVLQGNPLFGPAVQLALNQDWSRSGQPIRDPMRNFAAPEDWLDEVSSPFLEKVVGPAIGLGTVGAWRPAASDLSFLSRAIGGTAAQMYVGAADVLMEKAGVVPTRQINWSNMSVPDGTDPRAYEQIAKQLGKIDNRPWYSKWFPMFYGASGGAQTQASKVTELSKKDQAIYKDTRDLWSKYEKYMSEEWYPAMAELDKKLRQGEDEMTGDKYINAYFALMKARTVAIDALKKEHMNAITDPKQRQEFHDRMPGIPIRFQFSQAGMKNLEPTLLQQAMTRFTDPPQLQGRDDLKANPQVMSAARAAQLTQMATEWKMEPKDLEDQILAAQRGTKLPSLTIPAMWLEEAVTRYKYPKSIEELGQFNPQQLMQIRATEVQTMVEEYRKAGYNISYDDLSARIRARLSYPEERSESVVSLEKALSMSNEIRNPARWPEYALDEDGTPMGDPTEWSKYNIEIDQAKQRFGTDYNKWPRYIKELDDARRQANLNKLKYMAEHPDYSDYQRWFGLGKGFSDKQWDEVMAGETAEGEDIPRYKRGDPEDWAKWDLAIKMYEAAPRGGLLRRQLSSFVKQINRWATPGWRAALAQEALEMDQMTGGVSDDKDIFAAARNTEATAGVIPSDPDMYMKVRY